MKHQRWVRPVAIAILLVLAAFLAYGAWSAIRSGCTHGCGGH